MTKTVIVVEFFARLGIVNNVLLIQINKNLEPTANVIERMKRQSKMTDGSLVRILPEIKSLFPVNAMLKAVVKEKTTAIRMTLIKTDLHY